MRQSHKIATDGPHEFYPYKVRIDDFGETGWLFQTKWR